MAKAFPQSVFVTIVNEGEEGDEYLQCEERAEEFGDLGNSVRVARYELVEEGEVNTTATYQKR